MKNEAAVHSEMIFKGIKQLIEDARKRVSLYVNSEVTMLYWQIGDLVNKELLKKTEGQMVQRYLRRCSRILIKTYSYFVLSECVNLSSPSRNC